MLSITLQKDNKQLDIMVLPQQRISEVLKVLEENGLASLEIDNIQLYSRRKRQYVNKRLTFQQAELYSGDIIEVRKI